MTTNIPSLQDSYTPAFGHRVGFGKRPALLMVDFVRAYTTPSSAFYAPTASTAADEAAVLLECARQAGIPAVFTVVESAPTRAVSLWAQKIKPLARALRDGSMLEFIPTVTPQPGDVIIRKHCPSAFFGTDLAHTLTVLEVDTVIVAGCTTSGCIRATAVDGMQHGFAVAVPRSCVADRHPTPHETNLFDIDAKYGDVVDRNSVVEYFESITKTEN